MVPMLTQSQLETIADARADTSEGLTGSEIAHLLATCKMSDPSPGITKRHRLYNAFVESQNSRQDRKASVSDKRPMTLCAAASHTGMCGSRLTLSRLRRRAVKTS